MDVPPKWICLPFVLFGCIALQGCGGGMNSQEYETSTCVELEVATRFFHDGKYTSDRYDQKIEQACAAFNEARVSCAAENFDGVGYQECHCDPYTWCAQYCESDEGECSKRCCHTDPTQFETGRYFCTQSFHLTYEDDVSEAEAWCAPCGRLLFACHLARRDTAPQGRCDSYDEFKANCGAEDWPPGITQWQGPIALHDWGDYKTFMAEEESYCHGCKKMQRAGYTVQEMFKTTRREGIKQPCADFNEAKDGCAVADFNKLGMTEDYEKFIARIDRICNQA